MSWITKYKVNVPSYHIINGTVFLTINFTEKNCCTPASSSVPPNGFYTISRSYSQFRDLWRTLRGRVKKPLGATRRFRRLTYDLTHRCNCAKDHCEFDALYPILQSFPFPSRRCLRSKLTGHNHASTSARHDTLATFIALLHDFFSAFASATLREKLQDGGCLVLKTYVNFLAIDVSAVLRRPLTLSYWRLQCAEQMMLGQDEEEEDREPMDTILEQSEIQLTIPRTVEPPNANDLTLSLREENEKHFERLPLPALQIKTMRVHTMHSFMEEFCENVLGQFASDIDELRSPELTQARRWEICLYVACRISHTHAVQHILFNYADANTSMADGSSCLHIAARFGRSEIVALLIEEGADVNKANEVGVTPLILACRNGCTDVVKLLLGAGAKVSAYTKRGTYPLHAAIVAQSVEIVSMLVECGANVNAMTASGITPLHFAAKMGASTISEYLLRHDAGPIKCTRNDSDAMMIANINGHATSCELNVACSPALIA